MIVADAIYYYLMDKSAVTALIGTRLYKVAMPQNTTLPAVVYQCVGTTPVDHQRGASGLMGSRFQFTSIGRSYTQIHQIAEALRLVLAGYSGTPGDDDGGVQILRCSHAGDVDLFSEPSDASDVGTYQVATDFEIWHRVAVPSL